MRAGAITVDMLGLLKVVAPHGGIEVAEQGGMIGSLAAHGFVKVLANGGRTKRAAITLDGLRALAMRTTTQSGVALRKK
jgi:hypothetical protein